MGGDSVPWVGGKLVLCVHWAPREGALPAEFVLWRPFQASQHPGLSSPHTHPKETPGDHMSSGVLSRVVQSQRAPPHCL